MGRREDIIALLADGRPRSGAEIAARLGVSRTAVWKQVRGLAEVGLPVHGQPGRGYRLDCVLDLLDADAIRGALAGRGASGVEVEVLAVTASTSERLAALPAPAPGTVRACLAEFQTAGRGRRGRAWLSPYAGGLCLSVACTMERPPPRLQMLSLAVAVSALRGLRDLGVPGLALKWPNDVMQGDGKLAGILVDVDGETAGPLRVVVGIGVNVELPEGVARAIVAAGGVPPAALADGAGRPPSRSLLAAALVAEIAAGLRRFEVDGFDAFAGDWHRYDHLRGKSVVVEAGGERHAGTACGIGPEGELLVESNRTMRAVLAGEVSVRAAP